MHWTDWIAGPIIVVIAILPMAIARWAFSASGPVVRREGKPENRQVFIWIPLFILGFVHFTVVVLTLLNVVGGVALGVFLALGVLGIPVLTALFEWRRIHNSRHWRPLTAALVCIAADLIILPYLAVRLAAMQRVTGAG